MRGLGERAAGVQVFVDGGIVPIGEISDEIEQRTAQLLGVFEKLGSLAGLFEPRAALLAEKVPGGHGWPTAAFPLAAILRNAAGQCWVRWVRPKRGADDRPARGQRPPRPPDVQRRNVAVPNGLLAPRVRGDALDGQVNFDEAFGVVHRGKS